MTKSKLIIISTRLPLTVSKVSGKLVYQPSAGGLVTGISSVSKSRNSIWVGWPGIASDQLTPKDKKDIIAELKKHNCHPVFLTQAQIDNYYSGYCNATIWPLFHYFPTKAHYDSKYWRYYQTVNQLFYKATKQFVAAGAQIWVHDYQLMLLPQTVRDHHRNVSIGFFLHTPFPSFEIFRLLPQREELLQGILGADLVGFHTYDYVRHFLSSVRRVLGHESSLGIIRVQDRFIQTDAFPIGIDYKKFAKSPHKRKVKRILKSFNLFSQKTRVILTVDRSDYSKGIPARLDAYQLFLKRNPQYHGKVVMVLLAVPSRSDVEEYQELRSTIEQKVSRINGEFSTVDWSPITYRHRSLPFEELIALYSMADVMLVTPLRDGMNLVAKEFVATKHKEGGVLVLSEMAGVASELPEAVQVNPNNTVLVAKAIKQALEMSDKEQRERMQAMQKRISNYTIEKWAEDFLGQLQNTKQRLSPISKQMTDKDKAQLKKAYDRAESRLALLDYDGTLKDFVLSPKASLARPSRKVRNVLKQLTTDEKNKIIIVSGRPKNTLDEFFEDSGLGLIAEHGGWILDAGGWVKSSLTSKKWKSQVKPILDQYTARTPGSQVEEKDFALVWHYRRVSPDLAYVRAHELKMELRSVLKDSEADVFEGSKIVEVKPKRMHKGAIVTELLSGQKWDFILAIGDDYTDEDMFRALPERAYTINVGDRDTSARFQLDSVKEVVELLSSLPAATQKRKK